MTAQDWLPELDDDEEPPGPPPSRRRAVFLVVAGALLAIVAAVVAGLNVSTAARPAGTAPSAGAAAGGTAATPDDGTLLIRANLGDPAVTGGGSVAPLVVAALPLQGGVAPERVPNFQSCQARTAALECLPVQIRGPELGLTATFTVEPTASTPQDIGRLGFFFQAGDSSVPCPGGAWSPSDSFDASNLGQPIITGYVVLDPAGTVSPQHRQDVFRTLRLRVSKIRFSGRLVTVAPPAAGSLCPGTTTEFCVPLG